MQSAEQVFRRFEKELDAALVLALAEVTEKKITVVDKSVRTYHYKADHLWWQHLFSREDDVGLETARVQVWLTYQEPVQVADESAVQVLTRAELFRTGKESRKDSKTTEQFLVGEVVHQGIGAIVCERIERGVLFLSHAL